MSAARRKLGVGLIGAGSIAGYHLDGFASTGDCEIVAVAARSQENAAKLAGARGIPFATNEWRALLKRPDIDILVIATPDETHAEMACAAARAGKHILLQKPMAATSRECLEIIEFARAAGVHLGVSYMHRHFEDVVATRALLRRKAFGEVLSARLRNATPGPDWGAWFYSRASAPGGVVQQIGAHGIDLVRHLFGDVGRVIATTAQRLPARQLRDGSIIRPDNDDHAFAIYTMTSGAVISHEMCFCEPAGTDRFALDIVAERAVLHLRGARGALAINQGGDSAWEAPEIPQATPGARQHRSFVDMIKGAAPPDGSDEDGLANALIAEAIADASRTGTAVPVAQGRPASEVAAS